jgi:hypothetical protein
MTTEMTRDELVARLVRAGELEVSDCRSFLRQLNAESR